MFVAPVPTVMARTGFFYLHILSGLAGFTVALQLPLIFSVSEDGLRIVFKSSSVPESGCLFFSGMTLLSAQWAFHVFL